MPYIGDVFGGQAIELAGRVINPSFQQQGIGTKMLAGFVSENDSYDYLTTYTRNPSVLRMVANTASDPFPLSDNNELRELALKMDNAELHRDGIVYHFDRYDEGGLFGGSDPADRSPDSKPTSLKQRFPGLESARNALVLAAKIRRNKL